MRLRGHQQTERLTKSSRSAIAIQGGRNPARADEILSQLPELDVVGLGVATQQFEGLVQIEAEALHQDALCGADELPGLDGRSQVVLLSSAADGDSCMPSEDRGQS